MPTYQPPARRCPLGGLCRGRGHRAHRAHHALGLWAVASVACRADLLRQRPGRPLCHHRSRRRAQRRDRADLPRLPARGCAARGESDAQASPKVTLTREASAAFSPRPSPTRAARSCRGSWSSACTPATTPPRPPSCPLPPTTSARPRSRARAPPSKRAMPTSATSAFRAWVSGAKSTRGSNEQQRRRRAHRAPLDAGDQPLVARAYTSRAAAASHCRSRGPRPRRVPPAGAPWSAAPTGPTTSSSCAARPARATSASCSPPMRAWPCCTAMVACAPRRAGDGVPGGGGVVWQPLADLAASGYRDFEFWRAPCTEASASPLQPVMVVSHHPIEPAPAGHTAVAVGATPRRDRPGHRQSRSCAACSACRATSRASSGVPRAAGRHRRLADRPAAGARRASQRAHDRPVRVDALEPARMGRARSGGALHRRQHGHQCPAAPTSPQQQRRPGRAGQRSTAPRCRAIRPRSISRSGRSAGATRSRRPLPPSPASSTATSTATTSTISRLTTRCSPWRGRARSKRPSSATRPSATSPTCSSPTTAARHPAGPGAGVNTSSVVAGQVLKSGQYVRRFPRPPKRTCAAIGIDIIATRGLGKGAVRRSPSPGASVAHHRRLRRRHRAMGRPGHRQQDGRHQHPQRWVKFTLATAARVEVRVVRTDVRDTDTTALRNRLGRPACLPGQAAPLTQHRARYGRASRQRPVEPVEPAPSISLIVQAHAPRLRRRHRMGHGRLRTRTPAGGCSIWRAPSGDLRRPTSASIWRASLPLPPPTTRVRTASTTSSTAPWTPGRHYGSSPAGRAKWCSGARAHHRATSWRPSASPPSRRCNTVPGSMTVTEGLPQREQPTP